VNLLEKWPMRGKNLRNTGAELELLAAVAELELKKLTHVLEVILLLLLYYSPA